MGGRMLCLWRKDMCREGTYSLRQRAPEAGTKAMMDQVLAGQAPERQPNAQRGPLLRVHHAKSARVNATVDALFAPHANRKAATIAFTILKAIFGEHRR